MVVPVRGAPVTTSGSTICSPSTPGSVAGVGAAAATGPQSRRTRKRRVIHRPDHVQLRLVLDRVR